jgi:RecG-like helicase
MNCKNHVQVSKYGSHCSDELQKSCAGVEIRVSLRRLQLCESYSNVQCSSTYFIVVSVWHGDRIATAKLIYHCRNGVLSKVFSRLIPSIVKHLRDQAAKDDVSMDFLTPDLLKKHGLLPWLDALQIMHANLGEDITMEARQAARKRMVFNEALLLSLVLLHHRADLQGQGVNRPTGGPVKCDNLVCFGQQPAALLLDLH